MNAIQKYFNYRQSLIDQYLKGDMSKREYLQMNYDAVMNNDIGPFRNNDTVEKGLYNYQYYNALAKQMRFISKAYNDDPEMKHEYIERSNHYYYKKDRATMAVLRLLDYQNVEGYFVNIRSRALKGKLFEIVIIDSNMILHSTNELILKRMREENVFKEEKRRSLIDGYINQKY